MATSITLNSQTATQSQSSAATTQATSFLARCTEDLSPDRVSALDRQSTLWLVAAGATFVAFTVLAVGAFVATSFLAPAYVPFVLIGSLLAAMPAANLAKNFLEYSQNSGKEAGKYRAIKHHYEELSQRTPHQTQVDLMNRGIIWFQLPGQQVSRPLDVAALNPILAQAKYFDEKLQEDLQTKDKLAAEARDLANANFTENRQKIYELRNSALFAEDRAMETKIQAAFVNAGLRKADFSGTLEDIADLAQISFNERILGNELNDVTGINNFLTFKNRALAPISHADVKRMTVAELGQRLVAAMA